MLEKSVKELTESNHHLTLLLECVKLEAAALRKDSKINIVPLPSPPKCPDAGHSSHLAKKNLLSSAIEI